MTKMENSSSDLVKCEMNQEVYFSIPPEIRSLITIIQVEPKDFDYSDNEKWKQAKYESTKAYKAQKKIEFQIRKEVDNK